MGNYGRNIGRRDFLKAGALTVIGAGGLVACGGSSAAPASQTSTPGAAAAQAGGKAKLTFVVDTINEGHVKVRDQWARDFQKQHPNVTVDHQAVPTDYTTKIQTLFAGGTPPDVYRYLQEVTPVVTVAKKNLHVSLDEMIAADKYDLSDFRPEALELYRWDGKLYALPRDFGHQNVFYNSNLFKAAGLEPPSSDWGDKDFTFDRFLEMAQKLTKKKGNRTEQWGFLVNRDWRPWASWVYSNGAAVAKKNDQGLATEIALTDPNAVEALQFLQDLIYKYKVAPGPDIESETGGFELFASGRVAMMINNPSSLNLYRTIEAFEWDVAALPIGKTERRGTGGGGTGWAISKDTRYPEEAWEFLKLISSREAELDEVRVGATTPARVSVVESKEFQDPSKPPAHSKAFAQAQKYVVRDPVHIRWPEVLQRVITPTMDQLWTGKTSAKDVAAAIKEQGDSILAG